MRAVNGRDLDKKDINRKREFMRRQQEKILRANEKWLNSEYVENKKKECHPWKDQVLTKRQMIGK